MVQDGQGAGGRSLKALSVGGRASRADVKRSKTDAHRSKIKNDERQVKKDVEV